MKLARNNKSSIEYVNSKGHCGQLWAGNFRKRILITTFHSGSLTSAQAEKFAKKILGWVEQNKKEK